MQTRTSRSIVRVGFTVAAITAAAGCGSSASGPTADKACADLAVARCNERSMCSAVSGSAAAGASLVHVYGDAQTCVTRETTACKNGLAAPQTGQSPIKVETCTGEYATFSCQDFFDNNPPADCSVTGARAAGAACAFNGQCQSGYCQGTKNNLCGTCGDPPLPGADCTGSTCWHDQRCVASDMTCEAVVSLNGACDATHPCDNGLGCVGDTATTMGACQSVGVTVGAACGGSMPGCDGTLGLTCAGAAGAKTCAQMTFVGAGQPCGALADGSHVGCAAGDCYTATGLAGAADTGTCMAAVDAPGACDTVFGPGCLPPARCVVSGAGTAGACAIPLGSSCS